MCHANDTYMDKIQHITQRIEEIKAELMNLGDMRPGSLSVQRRSWGGEYVQLSYTHRGKGHTEYVRSHKQGEVERQVAAYRRFRELTKEWVDLAIELCRLRLKEGDGSVT
jgi:hypothetical protein